MPAKPPIPQLQKVFFFFFSKKKCFLPFSPPAHRGYLPRVKMAFVDGGYQGDEAQRAAFEASRITVTLVKRTDQVVKGFIVLPQRWVVERTLGGINRARRLSKDFEATINAALAWLQLALAFLIMRRLATPKIQQD
ncbi:transposase [Acidiphilium angustum]|uniref:transposase n=1 Tax=Acidiphilium angustum TaxID=523 RepID=UPI001B80881E|nr:transposase [Acidiphilium angustum]